MNIRASHQKDNIIFKYVANGGVRYDSSINRYIYNHHVDDYVYRHVKDGCEMAGLKFSHSDFNDYISSMRGYGRNSGINLDRWLSEKNLLSGEIINFNAGLDQYYSILKLNEYNYIVLDSNNPTFILSIVSTHGNNEIEIGGVIKMYPLGNINIKWISITPPDRVARTIDYINRKIYTRNKVSQDISKIVNEVLVALHQDEFELNYKNLVTKFAENGVSSGVILHIADAYQKKYFHHE